MYVRGATEGEGEFGGFSIITDDVLVAVGFYLDSERVDLCSISVGDECVGCFVRVLAVADSDERFACNGQFDGAAIAERPAVLYVVPTTARDGDALVVLNVEIGFGEVVDETGSRCNDLDRCSLGV